MESPKPNESEQSELYLDYLLSEDEYLNLQDLEAGQRVYAGVVFTSKIVSILPARVLAVLHSRVRLRLPSPKGLDPKTFVKTITPRFITHRNVYYDVVDCENNKSFKERVMEKNQPEVPSKHEALGKNRESQTYHLVQGFNTEYLTQNDTMASMAEEEGLNVLTNLQTNEINDHLEYHSKWEEVLTKA